MNHYNKEFFNNISSVSLATARKIIPYLINLVEPKSVVDVGCGTGAWLKTCKDLGIFDLRGYDGNWASEVNANSGFEFQATDLSCPIHVDRHFDVAISIEVGEHLPQASAATFVESLVSLSDLIVFSAAIPRQGGTNHLNEQWPMFWMELFRSRGFVHYDCFRAAFWEDPEVDACVAQNTFLYVKEGSQRISRAALDRIKLASDRRPIGIVNPRLFNDKLDELTKNLDTMEHFLTFKILIKMSPRLLRKSLIHHISNLFKLLKKV
jgi:hypothetical protein